VHVTWGSRCQAHARRRQRAGGRLAGDLGHGLSHPAEAGQPRLQCRAYNSSQVLLFCPPARIAMSSSAPAHHWAGQDVAPRDPRDSNLSPRAHQPADSSAAIMQPLAPNAKPNLQSCQFCRKRKIKCDKLEGGCSQCSRAQNECIYPASQRKGRPRKAGTPRPAPAPTPREALLLKKIWKLERVIDDLTSKSGLPLPVPVEIDTLVRMLA
jgi:Fungal Zn(2)-Cys(6) binuclear cluster domain